MFYRLLVSPSSRRSLCTGLPDLPQVAGQDPPPNPPLHPALAVVAAALEAEIPPQAVDASFDAGPPAVVPPPRPAVLQRPSLRRGFALPGHRHVLDPRLLEDTILPGHVKAPIRR